MENVENTNASSISNRRISCCSYCRRPGHNIMTCNDSRIREFELNCCIQCQYMSEVEFYDWLSETYNNNSNLLKVYARQKCRITSIHVRDLMYYKYAITQYIYNTYKYNYQNNENIQESMYPDNSEEEFIRTLSELYDQYNEYNQQPELQNDYESAVLFLEVMRRIPCVEPCKIFKIEPILQEDNCIEKNEECCICFDNYDKKEFVILNCNHEFCSDCIKKTILSDKRNDPCCPYCRSKITKIISRTNKVHSKIKELII